MKDVAVSSQCLFIVGDTSADRAHSASDMTRGLLAPTIIQLLKRSWCFLNSVY